MNLQILVTNSSLNFNPKCSTVEQASYNSDGVIKEFPLPNKI